MRRIGLYLLSMASFCWQWSQSHPYAIAIGSIIIPTAFVWRWVAIVLGAILIAGGLKGLIVKAFEVSDDL